MFSWPPTGNGKAKPSGMEHNHANTLTGTTNNLTMWLKIYLPAWQNANEEKTFCPAKSEYLFHFICWIACQARVGSSLTIRWFLSNNSEVMHGRRVPGDFTN